MPQSVIYWQYMASYNLSILAKRLLESEFGLLDSKTLKAVIGVEDKRSYYRIVKTLINANLLTRIEKDAYLVSGKNVNQFAIGNFLYQPSYISLESALNHWGILSQFPFEVTSMTPKRTTTKTYADTVYSYSHLASKYFGMFTKQNGMLLATPEKALFDQVYMASKGLRLLNFDEYDLTGLKKKSVMAVCQQLKADTQIMSIMSNLFES